MLLQSKFVAQCETISQFTRSLECNTLISVESAKVVEPMCESQTKAAFGSASFMSILADALSHAAYRAIRASTATSPGPRLTMLMR
jgi:DNA gyrase/topoisomerase IV subunit B